jgi:hypothetical protein
VHSRNRAENGYLLILSCEGWANSGRATVVEFADAKAIREGLGMSQAAFCAANRRTST